MGVIEKATAAVMEAMGDGPGTRDYLRCTAIARAVLTAIREPSETMISKVRQDAWMEYDDLHTERIWQTMIDAALEEGR